MAPNSNDRPDRQTIRGSADVMQGGLRCFAGFDTGQQTARAHRYRHSQIRWLHSWNRRVASTGKPLVSFEREFLSVVDRPLMGERGRRGVGYRTQPAAGEQRWKTELSQIVR